MSHSTDSCINQARCLAVARLWAHRLLSLSTVVMVLLFLFTALRRLRYPFSFDQIEGGLVTTVWRVSHGLPIYSKPSLDFVPYLYAPVYPGLCAWVSRFTGDGYVSLRLVSILATLATMAVICLFVRRETGLTWAGLVSAGVYAACYRPLQGWMDYGRVDSLFLFLLILGIYCARFAPTWVTALVWLVAFQTKQTALPVILLVLAAGWRRPRRMLTGMALTLVLIATSVWWMNHATAGWYGHYLFGSSGSLPFIPRQFLLFVPVDILLPLGLAVLVIAAALLFTPQPARSDERTFYTFTSFILFASIWYLRSHHGSAVNTLMPLYAWLSVLSGIALGRLYRHLTSAQLEAPVRDGLLALLFAAIAFQIIGPFYQTGLFVPGAEVRAARAAFEQQLAAIPGDVYVLNHSYDALLAGKQPHAVIDAFGIITDARPSPLRSQYIADFHAAVDSHRFSAFVLDGSPAMYSPGPNSWMPADFEQQYPLRLLAAGSFTRPTPDEPVEMWLYLPCSALTPALQPALALTPAVDYGTCVH